MEPPTHINDHVATGLEAQRERLLVELAEQSAMHRDYLEQLLADGFSRAEAFELVRDHHWWFTAGTLPPDPERVAAMLPWLMDALKSNASSPPTARELRLSKPTTTQP